MFQPVTVVQVGRYSTPLILIATTLIGAVPVSVSRFFALLKSLPPLLVMAKLAATPANWEVMYVRRLAMKLLMLPGEVTANPLLVRAVYLASSSGLTLALSSGPFTASCRARQ